jgi:hypothetical protein
MKKREKKMDNERFKKILRLITNREYSQEQLLWIDQFGSPDKKIIELSGGRDSGRSTIGLSLLTASAICTPWVANVVVCDYPIIRSHLNYVHALIETFSQKFDNLKPIIRHTKDSIDLDNGSRILFTSSANRLRGFSIKNVFFDMNVKEVDDIGYESIACIFPSVCPVGKILVSLEKK